MRPQLRAEYDEKYSLKETVREIGAGADVKGSAASIRSTQTPPLFQSNETCLVPLKDHPMTNEPTPDPSPEQPLQQIQHSSATARIPDEVGRGVFATAVIVLHGANEYTIDFVQSLARPNRVAARVILPPAVASQFVFALEQALEKYTASYGQPPREPRPPQPTAQLQPAPEQAAAAGGGGEAGSPAGGQPAQSGGQQPPRPVPQPAPIADIYDNLKLPDEMLGGVYANMASISHTASEFCFDFIAQFFPRSAVTARVYMAAPRVPELLGSLKRSIGS
jgi:hypothetical protein